jgi:hypothetical protein
MIPEKLTWWNGVNESYELWQTPEVKPGFHLYHFVAGVEVGRHGFSSALAGRKEFERRVTEAVNGRA